MLCINNICQLTVIIIITTRRRLLCFPLRRLSTMSTLLSTLPRLSVCLQLVVVPSPICCLSRTSRRSSPVHTRAAATFHCSDLFQGLVCRYAGIQSDYVPEQCIALLVDYVSNVPYCCHYNKELRGETERERERERERESSDCLATYAGWRTTGN